MAQFETWLRNDLMQIPEVTVLDGNFFSADATANRVGVIVTSDGEPVTLSGRVMGYIIRNDNASFAIEGELDGDRCWIDMTGICYNVVGPISIVIKVDATTVGACTGYVYQSMTDTIIDPGHIIPSLEELLEQFEVMTGLINDAEAARDNANTAADTANAAADNANTAADNANRMAEEAGRVNAEITKTNNVIRIAVTNRNNQTITKTAREPTLKITRDGRFVTFEAEDIDGKTTQTITDAPIDDGTVSTESFWSSDKVQSELNAKMNASLKGAPNGVAELDSGGKVPASQLPGYVDDILEYKTKSMFPATGEAGKLYVAQDVNLPYRWTGTQYVEISTSLAIGETSSTAHRGDHGKVAYDHALAKGNRYSEGLWVLATNDEGHVISARKATKADIGLGNVDNTADIDKPASKEMRDKAQEAVDAAESAVDSKIDAEAWAVGKRNGSDVQEGDETWRNSSKHWAQQSAESASAAEGYKNAAGQSEIIIQQMRQEIIGYSSSASASAEAASESASVAGQAAEDALEAKDFVLGMRVQATTLPVGSEASAGYSEGLLSLGIPTGATGAKGDKGDRGIQGVPGPTPQMTIGIVNTLPVGERATATLTGTDAQPILNLGLPTGATGAKGDKGDQGDIGPTPQMTIGEVTSLPAGSQATASITGTAENPVLNLGIPEGDAGNIPIADDTGEGATRSLWSADKITKELAKKAEASDLEAVQTALNGKASASDLSAVQSDVTDIQTELAKKVEASDLEAVQTALNEKASASDLSAVQSDVTDIQSELVKKANATDLEAVRTALNGKASASDLSAVQSALNTKASASDLSAVQSDVTDIQTAMNDKLDISRFEDLISYDAENTALVLTF